MTLARLHHLGVGLALGTLGTVFLHTTASGQVKTLLHPMLQPLVLGAGLCLLAAAALHFLLAPPAFAPMPAPLFAKNAARDAVVVAALIVGVACAPRSFSSLALANRTSVDPTAMLRGKAAAADAPAWQKDAGGTIHLEAVDLLMAAEKPETIAEMEGQHVRFIGQYVPVDGERFKMTRFLMFCCAADAQPINVRVNAEHGLTPLPAMAWAEVTGTVHYREEIPGKKLPEITLDALKTIPEPSDKFLY